jgi:hypothetical protein
MYTMNNFTERDRYGASAAAKTYGDAGLFVWTGSIMGACRTHVTLHDEWTNKTATARRCRIVQCLNSQT